MVYNESKTKRKIQGIKCLHKKNIRNPHTGNLTAHLQDLKQKEVDTPKRSRWQEINLRLKSIKLKK